MCRRSTVPVPIEAAIGSRLHTTLLFRNGDTAITDAASDGSGANILDILVVIALYHNNHR